MKIGLHSDLHTELTSCKISNLHELDLLILPGDIGNLDTIDILFERIRKETQDLPILYVLGNHEFYGMYYPDAKEHYRTVCKEYNVTLLDNEVYQVKDTVFIGTTLWTNFNLAKSQHESMHWAKYNIADFSEIFISKNSSKSLFLTPEIMVSEFQMSYDFLSYELQKAKAKGLKIVVISHFLPAFELVAKHFLCRSEGDMKSAYWASDLSELFPFVDYWIYGHSHTNIEIQATTSKTQFLCNQRGYSKFFNNSETWDYRHDYVVTI